MGRKIALSISGMLALVCAWLVIQAMGAGDTRGILLFGAFSFLFAVLPLSAIAKVLTKDSAPEFYTRLVEKRGEGVRFVPHWQLMTMIVIALIAIVLAIVIPLFR